MEILKQLGYALFQTIQLTYWTVKLFATKIIDFFRSNIFSVFLIIFVGCGEKPIGPVDDCDATLEMYCSLQQDTDGNYILEWNDNYTQTFASIYVDTHSDGVRKIAFASNIQVNVHGDWIDLVNTSSYTRDDGTTQTTLGVFEQQIGKVVTIYGGYNNECNVHCTDDISVKVVNEI